MVNNTLLQHNQRRRIKRIFYNIIMKVTTYMFGHACVVVVVVVIVVMHVVGHR